jgi:hypothetical protein
MRRNSPSLTNVYLGSRIILDISSYCSSTEIAYELRMSDSTLMVRAVPCSTNVESSMGPFDEYFSHTVLCHVAKSTHYTKPASEHPSITEAVVDSCRGKLLCQSPNSQLEAQGSSYCLQRINSSFHADFLSKCACLLFLSGCRSTCMPTQVPVSAWPYLTGIKLASSMIWTVSRVLLGPLMTSGIFLLLGASSPDAHALTF